MRADPIRIHPEVTGNMEYWSRKWGVSTRALHNAIMETGSLDAAVLKSTLRAQSWLHHPFRQSFKVLRSTVNFIF
jgi:hypothetical protein